MTSDRSGLKALARARRDEAARLTEAALADRPELARPALAAREEARIATRLAGYTPPTLDPSGPLPYGPARGGFERAELPDPWTGRPMPVRRRRGSSALGRLPEGLRAAAARYAALVEAVNAPGCPSLDAPRGGGLSDGGASSRCALAQRLGRAHEAIGPTLALPARGAQAHADRGRRSVSVRALVDMVCLEGRPLRDVLASHGWSRWAEHERRLGDALRAALERLSEVV